MTCRSIQRFCGAHHTPGLGALVADLVVCQINLRDGRVYLQCLCQALEAATDQGWRLVRGPFGQNLISDMSNLSDSKPEKQSRNPQFHSASTYRVIQLDWEYLTTQLDPR